LIPANDAAMESCNPVSSPMISHEDVKKVDIECPTDSADNDDDDDGTIGNDGSHCPPNGYDADIESLCSMQDLKQICSCTARGKKRSVDQALEGKSAYSIDPHHRRRRQKLPVNCSWIERIFSSTPFATPIDSDVLPILCNDTVVPLVRFVAESPTPECREEAQKQEQPHTENIKSLIGLLETQNLPLPVSTESMVPANPAVFQLGKARALMDALNMQTLDDELLALGLLTIVNDLLQDSYKIQATYRSYSFNGASTKNLPVAEAR
jgi:hypothetical protein